MSKKKVCQYVVIYIVLVLGIINSWRLSPWNHQDDYKSLLKALEPYTMCNCVYIYDDIWKIDASFHDICMFEGVVFENESTIDLLDGAEYLLDEQMLVYIANTCDQQVILDRILKLCPLLNSYEKVGEHSYATIYYLYGMDG